jgi:O-antigen ligase
MKYKNLIISAPILLTAISIPLYDRLASLAVFIWFLSWVLYRPTRQGLFHCLKHPKKLALLPVLFYLTYLLGMLWTSNKEAGWFDLEIKLSLILFPFLLCNNEKSPLKTEEKGVLLYFAIGCLVSLFLNEVFAILRYSETRDIHEFFYTSFSQNHHPSYLALFFTLGVAILLEMAISRDKINGFSKIVLYTGALILSLGIIQLSSKAGIIGLIMVIIIITIFHSSRAKKTFNSWVFMLVSITMLGSSIFVMKPVLKRFIAAETSLKQESKQTNSKGSTFQRLEVWRSSINVIKEHPFAGVGTGDVKDALLKEYKAHSYEQAYKLKLNSHNQFLQTSIALGIGGLIIFMALLLIAIYNAIRQKNIIFIIFLSLSAFHFLFESMLERQAGLVFFAFFYCFLMIKSKKGYSKRSSPKII